MSIRIAVCTAVAAVLLGGCGSSSSSSSTASSGPTSSAATSAAASTTAANAGGGSTTRSTSSAEPAATAEPANLCRAGDLKLSFLGGQGATGHGELGFALRNTGAQCSTGGYPGIQFLDRTGAPLPTAPQHTTDDFFGHVPLEQLTVAPGASFSFRLGVSHGQASSAGCQTAYGLQVIAPNDTATLRVSIPGGASECGATTVSPVAAGDSAYH